MTDERTLAQLREIGLTEYQSRAYAATVERGTVRLATLASAADIPSQRIYDVADALEEKQLVEVRSGPDGKEATAMPPETALDRLRRSRIEEFESTVDGAIDDLSSAYGSTDSTAGYVSVVTHEAAVERHVRRAIEDADHWLFCSLPHSLYESVADAVEDALGRGVTVRLLVSEGDAPTSFDVAGNVQVRTRRVAETLVAGDRAYGVYRGLGAPVADRPTLVTADENLVEMLQRYSQQYWFGAVEVAAHRTDRMWYFSPWLAIDDFEAVGLDPTDFEAVAHGMWIDSGERGEWAGRIVDTETETGTDVPHRIVIPEIATLTIETDEGERLTVGGWDATLEDVAAEWLELRTR